MDHKNTNMANIARIVFIITICISNPWVNNKSFAQTGAYPSWTHFSIDPILPGSSWGTGGAVLSDFDHDGDPDVALSRRDPKEAYWY